MPSYLATHDSVAYSVRISSRAKRARIEISALGKVHVIVPKRFNHQHIPGFIAQHRQWIHKTLRRIDRPPQTMLARPTTMQLLAIDEQWRITYDSQQQKPLIAHHEECQLNLCTHTEARPQLTQWLHHHARRHLIQKLTEYSELTGLSYNKVFIKNQKTRWGSCSSKGNINLNRNLLFLPQALVNYVLVHELCHTMHLNHSARFWRLVERYQPSYHQYDKQLHHAHRYIPAWAFPD